MNENSISLNKFISNTGMCSRREADTMIEEGRVSLNGSTAKKGNRVNDGDKVKVDGKSIGSNPDFVYLALNKPPGITCTTDTRDRDNIISFLNHPTRIFPIGRLDKASTGLILLTNDGDIVNKILRAENKHEKEYIVVVNRPLTNKFANQMANGVRILGTVTKKCKVEILSKNTFRIVLVQGLNRQIRRMCEHFDYKVNSLKRIRIMNIELDVDTGYWRDLTREELKKLRSNLD